MMTAIFLGRLSLQVMEDQSLFEDPVWTTGLSSAQPGIYLPGLRKTSSASTSLFIAAGASVGSAAAGRACGMPGWLQAPCAQQEELDCGHPTV